MSAVQVGAVLLAHARPRFKVGEFGGRFELSRADQFDEGSVNLFRERKLFLVREVGEFTELHELCTHPGCLVPWDEDDQSCICPCHGQEFGRDRTYIYGPAPRSLDSFAASVADGRVVARHGTAYSRRSSIGRAGIPNTPTARWSLDQREFPPLSSQSRARVHRPRGAMRRIGMGVHTGLDGGLMPTRGHIRGGKKDG